MDCSGPIRAPCSHHVEHMSFDHLTKEAMRGKEKPAAQNRKRASEGGQKPGRCFATAMNRLLQGGRRASSKEVRKEAHTVMATGFIESLNELISHLKTSKRRKLLDHLINMHLAYLELRDRLELVEKENMSLRDKLSGSGSVVFSKTVYFLKKGRSKDGPFCTRCAAVDNSVVRLNVQANNRAICPVCRTGYSYLSRPDKTRRDMST